METITLNLCDLQSIKETFLANENFFVSRGIAVVDDLITAIERVVPNGRLPVDYISSSNGKVFPEMVLSYGFSIDFVDKTMTGYKMLIPDKEWLKRDQPPEIVVLYGVVSADMPMVNMLSMYENVRYVAILNDIKHRDSYYVYLQWSGYVDEPELRRRSKNDVDDIIAKIFPYQKLQAKLVWGVAHRLVRNEIKGTFWYDGCYDANSFSRPFVSHVPSDGIVYIFSDDIQVDQTDVNATLERQQAILDIICNSRIVTPELAPLTPSAVNRNSKTTAPVASANTRANRARYLQYITDMHSPHDWKQYDDSILYLADDSHKRATVTLRTLRALTMTPFHDISKLSGSEFVDLHVRAGHEICRVSPEDIDKMIYCLQRLHSQKKTDYTIVLENDADGDCIDSSDIKFNEFNLADVLLLENQLLEKVEQKQS
jgi:hypothetical protein